jgi:hypothetical protein
MHSFWYVVPHLGSTIVLSHPTLYRLNIWSSWVSRKGTTQVMYIAKLKDGPKRVKKNFLNDFGKGFWNGMMEGEKMRSHRKGFLKLKRLSELFSSQNVNFPFIWRDFQSFSFFSFFISVSWGLRGFDDIWGENHFIKNLFSIGFNILALDAYSGVELCTPTWLNHDYRDGGVMDILAVDAYSGMDVCTPIFMGEVSN